MKKTVIRVLLLLIIPIYIVTTRLALGWEFGGGVIPLGIMLVAAGFLWRRIG